MAHSAAEEVGKEKVGPPLQYSKGLARHAKNCGETSLSVSAVSTALARSACRT